MNGKHSRFFTDFERRPSTVRSNKSHDIDDIAPRPVREIQSGLFSGSVLLFGLMLLGCLGLLTRLWFLQTQLGGQYQQRVDRNRIRTEIIPAPRGAIVDRYGVPVVENAPNFVVQIVPADVPAKNPGRDTWVSAVAAATHTTSDQITTILQDKTVSANDPAILRDHVAYDEAVKTIISLTGMPGISVQALPTRHYPFGPAFAPLLGYIGNVTATDIQANPQISRLDEIGKTGLEKQYNAQLQGIDGQRQVEHDVLNRVTSVLGRQDPVPGDTVTLTIDAGLQQHVYDELSSAVSKAHSTGGAAIAIDPQSGEILSMVSAPTYDNNWFIDDSKKAERQNAITSDQKLLLNRAISGLYPSGSIIKPIIGTAALNEHVVTPDTTVVSTGGIKVGPNFFPDWKAGGHGVTNLAKALADSVNTYFYEVGGGYQQQPGLGVDRIVKYLSLFGWGAKSGIDLPSEVAGLLPTAEWRKNARATPWRLGDTYHLAIGQGDLEVTPLQVMDGFATVANGGTLYKPHVVKSIANADGSNVSTVSTSIIRQTLVPLQYLQDVQFGLRQGVLSGSSRAMQSLPVPVAGKTGTAQFGNQGKTHAWYAVYAPYDRPVIAMIVIIEGGGEGNATALPVAKNVLQWYFTQGAGKSLTAHP